MADVLPAPVDAELIDGQPAGDAPAPRAGASTRAALPVIEGGLVTTVLTLAGLYWLAHTDSDFNPMGFYANYVIPVGAICVGLLAGSGYGVMSWLKGVKIRRGLLATIVVLQLIAYGAAEYVAYLDVVHRATVEAEADGDRFVAAPFLKYFHYKTENFAWKADHGNGMGQPLGHWGYFFVGLAAAGFVGGGLIAPLVCAGLPYCEGCQRYMKRRTLGFIPASEPAKMFKKKTPEADATQARMIEAAEKHVADLTALAAAGDVPAYTAAADSAYGPKRATAKLPVRVQAELIHCPACARGWVRHSVWAGQGKQLKRTEIARTEVGADFTTATLARPKA